MKFFKATVLIKLNCGSNKFGVIRKNLSQIKGVRVISVADVLGTIDINIDYQQKDKVLQKILSLKMVSGIEMTT